MGKVYKNILFIFRIGKTKLWLALFLFCSLSVYADTVDNTFDSVTSVSQYHSDRYLVPRVLFPENLIDNLLKNNNGIQKQDRSFVYQSQIQMNYQVLNPIVFGAKKVSPKEVGNFDFFQSDLKGSKVHVERLCHDLLIFDYNQCEEFIHNDNLGNRFLIKNLYLDESIPEYEVMQGNSAGVRCELFITDISVISNIAGYDRYREIFRGLHQDLPHAINLHYPFSLGRSHSLCITSKDLNDVIPEGLNYRFTRNALTFNDTIFVNPSFFQAYDKSTQSEILVQEQLYQFLESQDLNRRIKDAGDLMSVILNHLDNPYNETDSEKERTSDLIFKLNCLDLNVF